jgi:hypothetical protein
MLLETKDLMVYPLKFELGTPFLIISRLHSGRTSTAPKADPFYPGREYPVMYLLHAVLHNASQECPSERDRPSQRRGKLSVRV